MYDWQLFVDFIPIFIIYVFASDPTSAIQFSGSTLGKFVAICIIVFYASVNTTYGIFVCMLVLVYYQSDLVEEILNIEHGIAMENRLAEMNRAFQERSDRFHVYQAPTPVKLNWGESNARTTMVDVPDTLDPQLTRSVPSVPSVLSGLSVPSVLEEGFSPNDPSIFSYVPVKSYRSVAEDVLDNKEKKAELMAIFRKDNCVDGRLQHRGLDVHREMSDHVFREIRFDDEKHKCNVCDPGCGFSIIEEKLKQEDELKRPVKSNDIFTSNFEFIQGLFTTSASVLTAPIPSEMSIVAVL